MNRARTQLELAAQVAENNAPISEASGDHAQAELQRAVAADCREAIEQLQEQA